MPKGGDRHSLEEGEEVKEAEEEGEAEEEEEEEERKEEAGRRRSSHGRITTPRETGPINCLALIFSDHPLPYSFVFSTSRESVASTFLQCGASSFRRKERFSVDEMLCDK